jgi:ElaA protein
LSAGRPKGDALTEATSQAVDVTWECLEFAELSTAKLYAILALRSEVFVVEQECAYADVDGLDPRCIHLLGWEGGSLAAYARIVPEEAWRPGAVSIGRIVSRPRLRGRGLGIEVLARALDYLRERGNALPIELVSQHRLERFYERFGFESVGEPYEHDGQPHVTMVLDPPRDL